MRILGQRRVHRSAGVGGVAGFSVGFGNADQDIGAQLIEQRQGGVSNQCLPRLIATREALGRVGKMQKGVGFYRKTCDSVRDNAYEGFILRTGAGVLPGSEAWSGAAAPQTVVWGTAL